MINKTTVLQMPDGNEFGFYGHPFFGTFSNISPSLDGFQVSVDGFTSESLVAGARVSIMFSYEYSNPSTSYLNVSSTGRKNIKPYHGSVTQWKAGQIVDFVYDGTNWCMSDNGMQIWRGSGVQSGNAITSTIAGFTATDGALLLIDLPENTVNGVTLNVSNTGDYQIMRYYVSSNDSATIGKYPKGRYLLAFVDKGLMSRYWYVVNPAPLSDATNSSSTTTYASSKAVKDVYSIALSKYAKPSGGIPASDLATGVIPTNVSTFTNDAGYLTLATLPVWNGGVS